MKRWFQRPGLRGHLLVLGASFLLAMIAGWLGGPIDNGAYDWMFRRFRPPVWQPQSAVLAVDENTLKALGGTRLLRQILARGLDRLAAAQPRVVAIDFILTDPGDPNEDATLEAAFRKLPKVVLACSMRRDPPGWDLPLARFRRAAAAVGHVEAQPGPFDGVSRRIPLEKAAGHERYWALALEAFRLSRGVARIEETPDDLEVGHLVVPARWGNGRALRIRYLPMENGRSPIPTISVADLLAHPQLAERFRGKVVFVGATGLSAPDRFLTPYSDSDTMPGVEIHANVYETLAQGRFLVSASNLAVVGFCFLLALAAVANFAFLAGWRAYSLAILLLATAHLFPYALFTRGVVFPYFAPVSAAWLAAVGAGAWQFVITRRLLRHSEAERGRYQQALHFVTHEMRTPLTAIQGSSELMSRYPNLSDAKRRQIAELINSESKRLARMIETFLNVERLSAGEMELHKEVFSAGALLAGCVERAGPLAERKQIRLRLEPVAELAIAGDRELMEYAIYNLLTNAIKYSPAETEVTVRGQLDGEHLRLSVRDQGYGMDQQELKHIFQKFYRTRKAETSGERGTGIGLSIVDQIVTHHGGRIEVTSAPGQGSCFTVVLPQAAGVESAS